MVKELFKSVKEKLSAEVPTLKTVEWYRGQDTIKGGVKTCPSVYIEFDSLSVDTHAKMKQEALVSFDVILIVAFHTKNEDFETIAAFDLLDQIHLALKGLHKEGSFTSIVRTGFAPYHEASNYTKMSQSFECRIIWEAQRKYTKLEKIEVCVVPEVSLKK